MEKQVQRELAGIKVARKGRTKKLANLIGQFLAQRDGPGPKLTIGSDLQ